MEPELVHGTCIAAGPDAAPLGVLIRGGPGAGKSDLAFRCLTLRAENFSQLRLAPGPPPIWETRVRLISDDQVKLCRDGNVIIASAPGAIAGKIELNGIGILDVAVHTKARLVLVIDLIAEGKPERMPLYDPTAGCSAQYLRVSLARIEMKPFEASAPLKVMLALQSVAAKLP